MSVFKKRITAKHVLFGDIRRFRVATPPLRKSGSIGQIQQQASAFMSSSST
jgi:hypothetical protein